jgi:aldehyde dehydrogenase (NAD+)
MATRRSLIVSEENGGYEITAAAAAFLQQSPQKLLINGEWVGAVDGETFPALNPSDGRRLADLAMAGAEDVDSAVRAAQSALAGPWSRMMPAEREALLRKFAGLIETHAAELAELESLDNGKPISKTRKIDVNAAARLTYHAAGWPTKLAGRTLPVSIPGHFVYTRREPVGVVGIIIPWNYPLIHTVQKLAPALACGNTVIFKPAENASLVVLRLGELAQEAGFPPGVVNILTGYGAVTGAAMTAHLGIDKIAFTGSVRTGRQVITASAGNMKRLSLEMGNKGANIIFADADLDKAVPGAFKAAFGNTGQSCVAGARLYVQRAVYDAVVARLVEMTQAVTVGNALDEKTDLGPIVSETQLETVLRYIRLGREEGAELVTGGARG